VGSARPRHLARVTSPRGCHDGHRYADAHPLFVTEADQVIGIISTTDIVRAVANGNL
jgi:CBS domain-containing protein